MLKSQTVPKMCKILCVHVDMYIYLGCYNNDKNNKNCEKEDVKLLISLFANDGDCGLFFLN